MASPVVQSVAESANPTTAATSHTVATPSGVVAGDLLIVISDKGSTAATINALTGWTELLDENLANGLYIAYRLADGSEGASITLTTSASTRLASIMYRISGASDPAVTAPTIGTTATGTSVSPDPPSVTPPSSKDYLFIAFAGMDGEEADDDTWGNTPPTNYTPSPPRQITCGTVGTNLGGLILSAERQLTTGSAENPGTFNVDVSANWRSQTIIVPPIVPKQTSVAKISLASGPVPLTRTLHKLRVRARTTAGAGTIKMALYEGANNRSGDIESSALTTSLADYTLTIPDASAANIVDYSNLDIWLWGYSASGAAIVFEVDQVWLETPAGVDSPTATAKPPPPFMMRIPASRRLDRYPLSPIQGISALTTATAPIGGAIASGSGPVAQVPTPVPGFTALATGQSPGTYATGNIGGATCAGFGPTAQVSTVQGGPTAGGPTGNAAATGLVPGGATTGGPAPTEFFVTPPELPNRIKETQFFMFGPAGLRKISIGVPKQPSVGPTSETPTRGGATLGGFGPVATVPSPVPGFTALATGQSPGAYATGNIGGATASGFGPTATTVTVAGGATVSGQTGNVAATNVVQGGATESGNPPVPAGTSAAGGATAQGTTGEAAATGIPQGGATTGGPNPTDSAQFIPGPSRVPQMFFLMGPAGFRKIKVGQFNQPLPPIQQLVSGGATVGGFGPVAQVSTVQGGAVVSGTVNEAATTSLVQGGAIVNGTANEAATSSLVQGGAPAQGTTGETAATNLVPGGATTGGTAPGEQLETPPTATPIKWPMFMVAGPMGIRKQRRFLVVPILVPPDLVTQGGASTGGFGPTAQTTGNIGGAVANGRSATSTSTGNIGGCVLAGQTPTGATSLARGSAVVNGRAIPSVSATVTGALTIASGRAPTIIVAPIGNYITAKGRLVLIASPKGVIIAVEEVNAKGRIR